MTHKSRQVVFFFLLALFSYGIYKYYFDPFELEQNKPFTKGYSVENIELKITNEQGFLSAKFQSPTLIRYTDSPVIFIDSPLFWTYKKGNEQWLMSSDKAEYNNEKGEVSMLKNVEAKTTDESSDSKFISNDLSIDLKSNMAHTDNGITFTKEQFNMSGSIAQFDLEKEILSVKNNIKAIYKPIAKK